MVYILCQRKDQKSAKDCEVLAGETVTTQHRPVMADMRVVGKEEIQNKREDEDYVVEFGKGRNKRRIKKKVLQGLDTAKWVVVAEKIRLVAEKVLLKASGKTKKKETSWWNWKYRKQ